MKRLRFFTLFTLWCLTFCQIGPADSSFCVSPAYGWGTGHDLIGSFLVEFLPSEIQEILTEQNRKDLVLYSHYPDEPRKSSEEIARIIGERDLQLMLQHGMRDSMWLHSDAGEGVSLALLVRAMREKDGRKTAFYISELSHSFSDEAALNHTPMNNILICVTSKNIAPIPFTQLKDVPLRQTDLGACSQAVFDRMREELKNVQPRVLGTNFQEFFYASLLSECQSGIISSEVEEAISYASDSRKCEDEFVRLGVFQVRLLLDICWTAWTIAQTDEPVEIPSNWHSELKKRQEEFLKNGDSSKDSVFRELYETPQEPTRAETVGLLLEPFILSGNAGAKLSFCGRLLTACAGRTLRDAGFPIRPLNLPTIEKEGLPNPEEMPILLLCAGPCRISPKTAEHLKTFLELGGGIVWIGGSDPHKVTGKLGKSLHLRKNEEVPCSTKWSLQNEESVPRMRFSFTGPFTRFTSRDFPMLDQDGKFRFQINPNINGYGKPLCSWSVDLNEPDVQPLIWLENGPEKFCVAAFTENVVWLPEYLIFPFLISSDTSVGYPPAMRLDSFGTLLLLQSVELLIKK